MILQEQPLNKPVYCYDEPAYSKCTTKSDNDCLTKLKPELSYRTRRNKGHHMQSRVLLHSFHFMLDVTH